MIELLRYRDVTKVTYYRDLLEQSGIRTFLRNENLSTTEGVSIPDFFPALCILDEADQKKAIDLINSDRTSDAVSEEAERACPVCAESSPANFDNCWKCGSLLS
ncbi:MAG: DUF2007 domain-containing protein [Verrucomicrobiaceae bacterium]|nr:MAG: DUF2007 domain-containing protein [Verrucomicrobiaceae bacterium]